MRIEFVALIAAARGLGGLFGFHVLYYLALQNAPPAQASLINYLWPVLIVLFAALLPGERLRWYHLAGVVLGLAGTAVMLVDGGGLSFGGEYLLGYLAALGCALSWSGYSVLSRLFGAVPTDAKLNRLIREFIRPTNDDASVDRLLTEIESHVEGNADLTRQAIAGWTRILHFGDRYGTAHARETARASMERLKKRTDP